MSRYTVETTRAIWLDTEGVCIKVGIDRDVGELIEVYTDNAKSVDYFGEVRLSMAPELALVVGREIIRAAEEKIAQDGILKSKERK